MRFFSDRQIKSWIYALNSRLEFKLKAGLYCEPVSQAEHVCGVRFLDRI